jgi:hypothetical protein
LIRVGQAVATFDLGQETLRHEKALLFNGCRKHHIVPHLESPALARDGKWNGRAAPVASTATRGNMSTNAKDRNRA